MLDSLNTFILVASHQSFSKASKLLGISQPAVSRQISLLEEKLEKKLFSRSPKHVELTRQGQLFLHQLKPLMTDMENLLSNSKETEEFVSGDIRIGALSALGPFLDICIAYQNQHPECSTRLEYMGNDELISAVRENEIDFGIGTKPPRSEEFRVYKLFTSKSVMVASITQKKSLKKLSKESLPIVRYRFPSTYHQDPDSLVKPFLKKHGKKLGIKKVHFCFAVNSHYEMTRAIEELNAVAILPLRVVEKDFAAKRLKRLGDASIEKTVYLWHLTNPYMPVRLNKFKVFLFEELKSKQ